MEKLTIKRERLAKRCEICHQTDKFNAKKNYCKRCYKFIQNSNQTKTTPKIAKLINWSKIVLIVFLKLVLFILLPSALSIIMAVCGIIFGFVLDLFLSFCMDEKLVLMTVVLFLVGLLSGLIWGINIVISLSSNYLRISSNDNSTPTTEFYDKPYWADSKNIYA